MRGARERNSPGAEVRIMSQVLSSTANLLPKTSGSNMGRHLTSLRPWSLAIQNRRQKVVNRGGFTFVRGDWHSKLTKVPLIYSVSYFNLGALSPTKNPRGDGTALSHDLTQTRDRQTLKLRVVRIHQQILAFSDDVKLVEFANCVGNEWLINVLEREFELTVHETEKMCLDRSCDCDRVQCLSTMTLLWLWHAFSSNLVSNGLSCWLLLCPRGCYRRGKESRNWLLLPRTW